MSRLPSIRHQDTPGGQAPARGAPTPRALAAAPGTAGAAGSDTVPAGAAPVAAIVLDTDVRAGTYLLLQIPDAVLNLPANAPLPQQLQAMSTLLQELVNELTPASPAPPPAP